MEHRGEHLACRQCACRWTRTTVERSAQGLRRGAVDFAHRRALAGFAAAIRCLPNGPSALPELGALRRDGKNAAQTGRASSRCWRFGSERMFCGRHVCAGQKRGRLVGKTKRGKGTKIMGIADGHGLPLALRTESASPAEVKLVAPTLEERFVAEVPERLIGDKAYDSDRLDEQMMQKFGTEMIAPNRENRRIRTQDGRSLRRYVRRWKIERLFAWLF